MNYNNVGGTAQVTKQPQVNTVMAGFVQEEELIEDSENQRNIDMSELKNLLLWSHHTPHAHNDKMWAATADCTLFLAAPGLIEKRRVRRVA